MEIGVLDTPNDDDVPYIVSPGSSVYVELGSATVDMGYGLFLCTPDDDGTLSVAGWNGRGGGGWGVVRA